MTLPWSGFPHDTLTWYGLIITTIFGAVIGSFLNVVVHRLPREESLVTPRSRCPACGAPVKPYDNIPVISYLILGGKCRACRAPISARYPAIEVLTATLYALVYLHDGISLALPFDLLFVTALLALIFIDAEHMILPDAITLKGVVVALFARALVPNLDGINFLTGGALAGWPVWAQSLAGAGLGAIAGGGSLWLTGWLWERWRGVQAMGFGDVKMMFMVGAYLGWRLTLVTIFFAVLSGSVIGIAVMLARGERDLQMKLPFGIFLGAGAILGLLFGTQVINWYLTQFI